jgi:predicted ATP-dependent endonuclease of OLD family
MHLQRVQVPDFRVLKDVDITFEKDFNPRVFPLGSQNGGGKSTLLQLIFVLLHCSANPDRHFAIKNLLSGFTLSEEEDKRVLAIIDIWDGEKVIVLEFFICNDNYINKMVINDLADDKKLANSNIILSNIGVLEEIKRRISHFPEEESELQSIIQEIKSNHYQEIPQHLYDRLNRLGITEFDYDPSQTWLELQVFGKTSNDLRLQLSKEHKRIYEQADELSEEVDDLIKYLKSNCLEYILKRNKSNLLCSIKNLDLEKLRNFLLDLSNKIFLAAPLTQVFLFQPKQVKRALFSIQDNNDRDKSYLHFRGLDVAKSLLNGLFTYDFLAVDLMIEFFKSARDNDFTKAVETGEYGNNYKNLLVELSSLLNNKVVNVNADFSGITFTDNKSDKKTKLYSEDLSHGELKRLSIYCWLKYNNIQDAIVLMDEVDLALHPDWQYNIVSDLVEWVPSNQYILATHSYELCEALTPSHVKVLEPKLTERRSD